jgi:hypothetical protein
LTEEAECTALDHRMRESSNKAITELKKQDQGHLRGDIERYRYERYKHAFFELTHYSKFVL